MAADADADAAVATMTFGQQLKEAANSANLNTEGGVQQCVTMCVDAFKAACVKAAAQSHHSAKVVVDKPMPAGVTATTLMSNKAFYVLLKAELDKLKLIRPKFSWSCYEQAEVQEKVKGEDGQLQYKALTTKLKDKSVLTKYPNLNTFKKCDFEGKEVQYAGKELLLKKAKGKGLFLKVNIEASWPGEKEVTCCNGVIRGGGEASKRVERAKKGL